MSDINVHAPIAPSSLDLTVKCPGSVRMQLAVPPVPDTEEIAEGKAAHYVALVYARGGGKFLPIGTKFKVGLDPREWIADQDMITGATYYANALGGFHTDLRTEDSVAIPRVHPEYCYGTPDGWRFFPDARIAHATCPPEISPDMFDAGLIKLLRVGDYKYGHRYVEAYGNYQMVAYASGVMDRLGLNDLDPNLWVEMFIAQPRAYHREGAVRYWRVQAHELRSYLNEAMNAAAEALSDNPRCTTNDSCIDCRARHVCKTKQYAANALVEFSMSAEIVELPPEALGVELAMVQDAIKRLEARETGLAAQAEAVVRQGRLVPFFHMEAGQSRLTYRDDVDIDEVTGLGDLLGVQLRKEQTKKDSLVTPTQAIQLGIDEATMKHYAYRPHAALKLTRDNSVTAKKVFSK